MEEKYVGKEVNLGCFTHVAIFFVALCCYVWYDDVREIAKDLHFIRQHIENSTLEITYRNNYEDVDSKTPLGTLSLHCFYPEYITEEEEDGDGIIDNCWINGHVLFLDERLFPEVTFENSPMEVELVIKK